MELEKIKILVDKYYDGATSKEEERAIADYLSHCKNLPVELAPVKMMFEALGLLRNIEAPAPEVKNKRYSFRWSRFTAGVTVAASILLAIIVTTNKTLYVEQPSPAIICHVDGALVNDQAAAEDEARRILGNMNENITLAMASVDKINILAIVK